MRGCDRLALLSHLAEDTRIHTSEAVPNGAASFLYTRNRASDTWFSGIGIQKGLPHMLCMRQPYLFVCFLPKPAKTAPADLLSPVGEKLARRAAEQARSVVLPKDDGVALDKNLHRIAHLQIQRPAQLDRQYHSSQIVPLCQVGAKKFYKLSEKPLISMALGFPDGATMHLRGFDRLCYFRSKFDRFAPKGNIGVNSQLRCFHRCRFSIR